MSAPVERVAAVILAAGESRRYGGRKLIVPFEASPSCNTGSTQRTAPAVADVILLLGHAADEVLAAIEHPMAQPGVAAAKLRAMVVAAAMLRDHPN